MNRRDQRRARQALAAQADAIVAQRQQEAPRCPSCGQTLPEGQAEAIATSRPPEQEAASGDA